MPATLQQAQDYLGIDFKDASTDRMVNLLIAAADSYLQGAISPVYPRDDPRASVLALAVISDFYDNRGTTSEKVGNTTKLLISDFCLQLQMEGRAKGAK